MKKTILLPFALAFGLTCMTGCEMESHKKAPSEPPAMKEAPADATKVDAPRPVEVPPKADQE